ncbi:MAG: DUF3108 domain-containing protein, partial [Candidatus Sulfomarinibacteraceae bacterium]
ILPGAPVAASGAPAGETDAIPYPVNEKLTYAVSWMGIRCGQMEIVSFTEPTPGGKLSYRIVVLMRTSRFFDGIYRVRSRLDSFVDPALMSSVRYEERSLEKKKRKEDVWVVDIEKRVVVRTKNGDVSEIPIEVDRAFDPLAFIFRLRTVDLELGGEKVLGLMTSKGAVETVVRAKERKKVRTKMGKCDAVAMIPEPRDKMMFSKSGSMVVWIDHEEPNRPCRIEFDLSFGTLVASLQSAGTGGRADVVEDWENWGEHE